MVEANWHFIIECATHEDIHKQFKNILKVGNLNELFGETRLQKLASHTLYYLEELLKPKFKIYSYLTTDEDGVRKV